MKKTLLMLGGMAGATTAIIFLWIQLGGSVPATRQFVADKIIKVEMKAEDLDIQSAKHGTQIYKMKLRSLIIIPPPTTPEQRVIWQEIIDDTRRQQKFYEELEIRLHRKNPRK